LQDALGFGSYETAWAWLHKLRRAMVRPERELLSGVVELDQSFLGGRSHGKAGGATEKAPITIAVERLPSGRLGRARLQLADMPSGLDQVLFAREVIAPGTEIHTDGALVLTRLSDHGFTHHPTPGYLASDLDAVVPGPHLVSSLLKRWSAGTLHHRISRHHLPYYLDGGPPEPGGCCSTDCSSRQPAPTRTPSASSSAAPATTGTNPHTTKRQLHSNGYPGHAFNIERWADSLAAISACRSTRTTPQQSGRRSFWIKLPSRCCRNCGAPPADLDAKRRLFISAELVGQPTGSTDASSSSS